MVYGQVAWKSSCPKLCRLKCWVTELYRAHNFITLNNILASLLHYNRTCFVTSKIKEWDTLLIYCTCFVFHQGWKSEIFYTFVARVSSHHCLKNEICYTIIPLVLPHDGLKNKVYYTHSLFKKNQLVCLCPSTDKIERHDSAFGATYIQARSNIPPKIPLMNLLFGSWIRWLL